MTWTKLSDDFGEDAWILTDQAFRLHVEALIWSNSKLLDGRITKDDIRRFAKHPDAVPELLEHEFWTGVGDAFVIVHHLQHQWSRDQTVAFRQSRLDNGKKGGRPRKKPRANHSQNHLANQGGNQGDSENHGANHSENHLANQGGNQGDSENHGANHSENLRGREGKGKEGVGKDASNSTPGNVACTVCGERIPPGAWYAKVGHHPGCIDKAAPA